jgi:hypothetical protein
MAETFKRDKKPELVVSPVIKRSESELHSPIDSMARASEVRPREAHLSVARADLETRILSNREKYDSEGNPIGRRFASLIEKV